MNKTDFRTRLKQQLHEGTTRVTFTKLDGNLRIMDCTVNPDLIPPSAWPQGKIEVSKDTANRTIRVFDIHAQGWRSFVVDNVISYKYGMDSYEAPSEEV